MAAPIEVTIDIDEGALLRIVDRLVGRDDCHAAKELQRVSAENDRLRGEMGEMQANYFALIKRQFENDIAFDAERERIYAAIRAVRHRSWILPSNIARGMCVPDEMFDALIALLPPEPAGDGTDAGEETRDAVADY